MTDLFAAFYFSLDTGSRKLSKGDWMKIKILSYNIHKGFNIGNRHFILEEIKHALNETQADVLFLQEILGENNQHKIPNWKTSIQFEYIADVVWPHYAYGKNAIYPEGHHGNAILSKYPITQWENHNISTNRFEQRGFLKAEITHPESHEKVIVCNTHLDLTQRGREKQANFIVKKLENEKMPWVLVGDFNDWNFHISKIIEQKLCAHDVFQTLHGRFPKTYPSIFPILSLDRVFSFKMKPTLAKILNDSHWKRLSDHLPLYVELST